MWEFHWETEYHWVFLSSYYMVLTFKFKTEFFCCLFLFYYYLFFSWEKYLLFSPGYLWSCCVDQSSLELTEIYLFLPFLKLPSKRLITFSTNLVDWKSLGEFMFCCLHFLSTETMLAIATGSPCVLGMIPNTLYFLLLVRIVETIFILVL